jgi:nifR3 family TIM-barrel protein
MQKNFWKELYFKHKGKKPILVIAPMADVTDTVFRELIVEKSGIGENSNLDVLWTEFVSVNGLSHEVGKQKLLIDLDFSQKQRPIVAQIFGEDPKKFENIAKLCFELGFDGIDINMGCPDKNVLGQKSGSYLINTPEVAKEIFEFTKKGSNGIPVSIKTRIGYNKIEYKEWLGEILKIKPEVITIHLRTKKEMSLVSAHWEIAPEIVSFIRENFGFPENGGPIIILNGDVKSVEDAFKKWQESACDGIMIGRGLFGNPWFFNKSFKKEDLSVEEILNTAILHTKMFEEKLGEHKSFAIMKKHFKAYVQGFSGAKDLRIKLMETRNSKEVETVIEKFLNKRKNIFYKMFSFFKNIFLNFK